MKKDKRNKEKSKSKKPISLYPLKFNEAVANILKIKPAKPECEEEQKIEKGKHE